MRSANTTQLKTVQCGSHEYLLISGKSSLISATNQRASCVSEVIYVVQFMRFAIFFYRVSLLSNWIPLSGQCLMCFKYESWPKQLQYVRVSVIFYSYMLSAGTEPQTRPWQCTVWCFEFCYALISLSLDSTQRELQLDLMKMKSNKPRSMQQR
jgi:hypothetical protein